MKDKSLPVALAAAKFARKKMAKGGAVAPAGHPGASDPKDCLDCMAKGGLCEAHMATGGIVGDAAREEDRLLDWVEPGPEMEGEGESRRDEQGQSKARRMDVVEEILHGRAKRMSGGGEVREWEEAPVDDFSEHPDQPEVRDPLHDAGETDEEMDEGIVGQILDERRKKRRGA